MNTKVNFINILFLDIETVPEHANFDNLDTETQKLFALKTQYQRKDDYTAKDFYERAGIWAEFGKIICISVGFITKTDNQRVFRVTTFSGKEKKILQDFKNLLETHYSKQQHVLCAHNGKEFDFPYIARRMIINKIKLPEKLNLFGKKPWEIAHLDTMEMWKFGDYKHYTSLKLLTKILGIPSPKDDIDGSQVRDTYYKESDLNRIITYCEKDTIAIAQVLLRLYNEPLLQETEIQIV